MLHFTYNQYNTGEALWVNAPCTYGETHDFVCTSFYREICDFAQLSSPYALFECYSATTDRVNSLGVKVFVFNTVRNKLIQLSLFLLFLSNVHSDPLLNSLDTSHCHAHNIKLHDTSGGIQRRSRGCSIGSTQLGIAASTCNVVWVLELKVTEWHETASLEPDDWSLGLLLQVWNTADRKWTKV